MAKTPLKTSYWPAEPGELRDITVCDANPVRAATVPGRLALVDCVEDRTARRQWTYAEFAADIERPAQAVSRGDRIAIWAPNSAEWVILQQAVAMAGMVLVVLNRAYRSREMTFVLQQSGVVALFLTDSYRGFDMRSMIADARPMTPALREILSLSEWDDFLASADQEQALPEPKPGDLLQIQYTSGTTGFPKGPRPTTKGLSTRPHSSLNGLAWTTAGSTSTRCRCTTLAVEW